MALEKLQLSNLLALYGSMLTDKQRDAISMYVDCDCSLSEIADEVGITRQGVRDAIVNGEKTLVGLENNIHFADFIGKLTQSVSSNDIDRVKAVINEFLSKE